MRRLLGARLVLSIEKAEPPDNKPKPTLPPINAESLRKVLLLVDIRFAPVKVCYDSLSFGRGLG
jgi:hypothetical protein